MLSNIPRLFYYPTAVSGTANACFINEPISVRFVLYGVGGAKVYLSGSTTPYITLTPAQAPASFNNYPVSLQGLVSSAVRFDNVSIFGSIPPQTPLTAIATGMPSSIFTQWGLAPGATDYVIEYKPTSGSTWTTFSDGVSSKRGSTITGLSNGTSYDVRVSSIVGGVTSSPSTPVSATPSSSYNANFMYHVLSTGQSLSVGASGTPALSTTQPYNNKKLASGNTGFTPLVESSVETMSSSLANALSATLAPSALDSIVTLHGVSSTAYSGLKKGTTPYANGIAQFKTAFELSLAAGRPYNVAGITVIHGETDEINGVTAAQYEGYLTEWQSDYQSDVTAVTGQARIPLFTDQTSTRPSGLTPRVPLGQLSAAKNNPNSIYLVTPKYMLEYADSLHLNNYSYRRLGEYYAKVIKRVVIDGQNWLPVMPTSVTRIGNIIYADFNVPVAPLQFDTTAVLAKTNYGFEYSDSTSSASISTVELYDGDTVKITLNTTPTGSSQRLRYAYTAGSGAVAGRNQANAARGNLRDSDTTPAQYNTGVPADMGTTLPNWAVTFDEAITELSVPGAPTSVSATAGNGQATVSFTAPASDGGSTITGYTITSTPGSITTTGASSPIVVTGLTNGQAYTFTVTATNAAGSGSASTASNSVIPTAPDTTPPALSEVTPISNPTSDSTPSYTFSTTEAGTISYGGSCTSATTSATSGSNTITFNTIADGTYTNCTITVTDAALNASNVLSLPSFTIDTVMPTISNITSSKSNGSYTVGEVIPVNVTFSEAVTSIGNVTITFETGVTDHTCTFSVSNAISGSCDYIVHAGDISGDLQVQSVSGNLIDQVNNAMIDFSPTTNLATNKDIVINTTSVNSSSIVNGSYSRGHYIPVNSVAPAISIKYKFNRKLSLKMKGEDVKALQKYLNSHGYLVSLSPNPGSIGHETNYFGLSTKRSVIKFQKANGLKVDGIVGSKTIMKIE